MSDKHAIARYRRWYRMLLRLHGKSHRERFADGMEQTFHDICRERAEAGSGLTRAVLWMFCETATGIVRQHTRALLMQLKHIVRWALVAGCALVIPLLGNLLVEGWNWTPFDFVVGGALIFGAGLAFELVASQGGTTAYRIAVGIACVTGLLLVWINGAVGIIGDGPVNVLYLGVLAVGFVGAWLARFQPRSMAWALAATAVAQMIVPTIAWALWSYGWQEPFVSPNSPHPGFHPGVGPVFVLNAVFAAAWLASAAMFRRADGPRTGTRSDAPALGAVVA